MYDDMVNILLKKIAIHRMGVEDSRWCILSFSKGTEKHVRGLFLLRAFEFSRPISQQFRESECQETLEDLKGRGKK